MSKCFPLIKVQLKGTDDSATFQTCYNNIVTKEARISGRLNVFEDCGMKSKLTYIFHRRTLSNNILFMNKKNRVK